MKINLEQIKQNYNQFDDYKIEHLAMNEADGIEPEVIPILIDEIKKRGLDAYLIEVIEVQQKKLKERKMLGGMKRKDIELFEAVKNDSIQDVIKLLKKPLFGKPANIGITDEKGSSLLHIAIENSNLEIISILVRNGADIYKPNNKNQSPLRLILLKQDLQILDLFAHADFSSEAKAIVKNYEKKLKKDMDIEKVLTIAEISMNYLKAFDFADKCLIKAEEIVTPPHYVDIAKYFFNVLKNKDKAYYYLKLTENYTLYYESYITLAETWHDLYKNKDETIANMERAISSFYEDIDMHYSIAFALGSIASAWKRILNDKSKAEHYLIVAENLVMEKATHDKSVQFTMLSNAWNNVLGNSIGAKRCNQLAEASKIDRFNSLLHRR